jgi:hypothetical protein
MEDKLVSITLYEAVKQNVLKNYPALPEDIQGNFDFYRKDPGSLDYISYTDDVYFDARSGKWKRAFMN